MSKSPKVQSNEFETSNGQAGESHRSDPIYGAFDTATKFLNSLADALALERDKLRSQELTDEDVADRILTYQKEGETLRFVATPVGRSSVISIAANITTTSGVVPLDVCKLDPADVSKRSAFAERLSDLHPAIDVRLAEQKLMQLAADLLQQRMKSEQPVEPTVEELLERMPEFIRAKALSRLKDPQLLDRVVADIQTLGVAGEPDLVRMVYLTGVSRLLPKPLATIIQSLSSSGKSFVVDKTVELFPPEAVIRATSITPQALYYVPYGALRHKFVVAGERSRRIDDGIADATKALREMIGSGKLSKLLTTEDKNTGGFVTVMIEQPGPIAYCESTTASDIFNEDANRCLLISTDERPEQTRRVLNCIGAAHCDEAIRDTDTIIQVNWALQRMLKPRKVVVPYAKRLAEKFSEERVEARRAISHLLSMVGAVALLYQYQRELDSDGRIIAALADYQIAAELCSAPLARLLGGKISDAAIRFHGRLQEWAGTQFTTTEAVKADGKSRQAVYGWLEELASIDAVTQLEPGKGGKPAVWRLTEMPHAEVADGGFQLPTVAELKDDQGRDFDSEPDFESKSEVDDYVSPF